MERWKRLRQEVKREILREGFDQDRGCFTRYYGSHSLDASLLTMPHVGFLPPTDERVKGTVAAIERELHRDGFVMRYSYKDTEHVDGLPSGEGAFLACSVWLADNYGMQGRQQDARGAPPPAVGSRQRRRPAFRTA